MSGHSKWATTKHKKAIVDAKRSKTFTKVAKLITVAARDGKSDDPEMNPGLRLAIDNAKAVGMPKDNIDRAIKRGFGNSADSAALEEITYEAYAPGGVAILIECLTDNKNRALSDLKNVLNKNGGSFASGGSVAYLFKKVGQIIIDRDANAFSNEELEMTIIDSGADDFDADDGIYIVTCDYAKLDEVKKNLQSSGLTIGSAEIIQSPQNYIDVNDDRKESLEKLLELLDELDDVSSVYSNANL